MSAGVFAAGRPALIAAPVMASDAAQACALAERAIADGADMVELRGDCLADPLDAESVVGACRQVRSALDGHPLLFTLRTRAHGGAVDVDAPTYERIVHAVVDARVADVVDVESSALDDARRRLVQAAHEAGIEVISSHHDIDHTPSVTDMVCRLEQLRQDGADLVKAAYQAHESADAQRVLAATCAYARRQDAAPLCAIAMGDAGTITRVLGQAYGTRLSFAAIERQAAPGQLSVAQAVACSAKVDEFSSQGRYSELVAVNLFDPDASVVALLGSPVGHSLSPAMHNLSFEQAGIHAYYVALECAEHQIASAIEAMRANPAWVGCNVTMPCKQEVIRHLDGLDDAAALSGAVNTIAKRGRRLVGYNTDGVGFVASLKERGVDVAGARVCVIGGGGAARAIGAQCALDGAASVCFALQPETAKRPAVDALARSIAADTSCRAFVLDCTDGLALARAIDDATVLANATPCGMGDDRDSSPVPPGVLRAGLAVADAVYAPVRTKLLQDAERAGCTCVTGLGMLLHQAAAAERIWFDCAMLTDYVADTLFGL